MNLWNLTAAVVVGLTPFAAFAEQATVKTESGAEVSFAIGGWAQRAESNELMIDVREGATLETDRTAIGFQTAASVALPLDEPLFGAPLLGDSQALRLGVRFAQAYDEGQTFYANALGGPAIHNIDGTTVGNWASSTWYYDAQITEAGGELGIEEALGGGFSAHAGIAYQYRSAEIDYSAYFPATPVFREAALLTDLETHALGVRLGAEYAHQPLDGLTLSIMPEVSVFAAHSNMTLRQDPNAEMGGASYKTIKISNSETHPIVRPGVTARVAYDLGAATVGLTASADYTYGAPTIELSQSAGQVSRMTTDSSLFSFALGADLTIPF